MSMGPGFGGPNVGKDLYNNRPRPPRNILDVPRYLWELVRGFFGRLAYIFQMVWETGHWLLISLLLVSILLGVMPVISSLISKEILNELQDVITARASATSGEVPFVATFWGSAVMLLLIASLVYRVLHHVMDRLYVAINRIAGEKVVRHVRVQIMKKAKELDISAFDLPEFYEKLENANREAGNRPVAVLGATFDALSRLISLASYIVILATAPGMWWTAPVMILVSIPTAIVNFSYRRKTFLYMRDRSKERRQMNYYSELMVNKDMVKEIRMFDLSDRFIERYDTVFGKYYAGLRKLIVRESVWHVVLIFLSTIVNCVFFALIAIKVFDGTLQIGDYSLYTGALTSISTSVAALIRITASVYEGTLFIDNLISFMKVKPTVVPLTETPAKVEHGKPHTIEFENVSFSYPGSDRLVLDHISLKFRPGETVVLVGLNGAGKTTFIKLLTRLYDPTEGRILLDGKDLREYDPRDLYRMFGIIFQDFGKYAVSVTENVKFGDVTREGSEEEVHAAATAANAADFISRLPDGYETPLMRYFEPNGIELSIGQWQKLAIARAFYSQSDILILDEPTASLDPIAEQEIFNQFDQLRQDKTTIFVSHRLSSATVASKIVVLEYGKLIEEGTHKELMEKEGRYFELFTTQARRYLEETEEESLKDHS